MAGLNKKKVPLQKTKLEKIPVTSWLLLYSQKSLYKFSSFFHVKFNFGFVGERTVCQTKSAAFSPVACATPPSTIHSFIQKKNLISFFASHSFIFVITIKKIIKQETS